MKKSDSIRVFISSTFVGLEKERDYLMRMVFPKIKFEALKRNLSFVPIDLRWGVTKEQAEQGKIPWICLNEINNSKPYFIGILGKRYGWQPPMEVLFQDTQLGIRYPSLRDDMKNKLSMTEIEIQNAVLRNTDKMDAFFYVTKDIDIEDAQQKLIDSILSDNRYPVKYFNSPKELGELVEKDLFELIDKRFPFVNVSEALRIKKEQESSFNHLTSFYIPRKTISASIDNFVENEKEHTLVIYGTSGCGKSSVLANWVDKAGCPVFYFFAGGSFSEKSVETVQKHLIAEIRSYLMITDEETNSDYYNQLVKAFDLLCVKGEKVAIVIDGMDQIIESDEEHHALLSWLPVSMYPIKLIVSTNQVSQKTQMEKRGVSALEIPNLTIDERKLLVELYLRKYSKELTNYQIDLIVNDKKSSNAITLSSMLNEMVFDSVYETVAMYICQYNKATSNNDFLKQMLHRAINKYTEGLVINALGLICSSYSGLGIDDLLSIVGVTQLEWSYFYCSYSFLFSEHNGVLSINPGIRDIVFEEFDGKKHDDLYARKLVFYYEKQLLLNNSNNKRALTAEQIKALLSCELLVGKPSQENIDYYISSYCLSNYMFEGRERCFEELSYQYWKEGNIHQLYKLLLDPGCFVYLKKTHSSDLIRYWNFIHNNDEERSIKDYSIISNQDNYTSTFLCDYYSSLAHLTESFPQVTDSEYTIYFLKKSIHYTEYMSSFIKRMFLIPLLNKLGLVYGERHDNVLALECFKKAVEYADADDSYSRSAKNHILLNCAQKMMDAQQFDSCIKLCLSSIEKNKVSDSSSVEKELYLAEIYEVLGNAYAGLANSSDHYQDKCGYLEHSIRYMGKSLQLRKKYWIIDPNTYAIPYVQTTTNMAMSCYEAGHYKAAIEGFEEAEKTMQTTKLSSHEDINILVTIQMNYGSVLTVIAEETKVDDYYVQAWQKLKSAFGNVQELYNTDETKYATLYGDVLYSIGRLFRKVGQPDKSIKYYENAIKLYEQDKEKKAMSFVGLGLSYSELSDEERKRDALFKAIEIYKSLYADTSLLCYENKVKQIEIEISR